MSRNNTGTIILILGALALGAYFLLKNGNVGGAGGASGGGDVMPLAPQAPQSPGVYEIVIPGSGAVNVASNGVDQRQMWSGAAYGARGQPSIPFLGNLLQQAARPGAPAATIAAAQAVGSAPPRVVAKIKAGRIY